MELITIYNNNAILVNDAGKECVVIGNGIGFGIKGNKKIDESKIDKKFIIDEKFTHDKFDTLMNEIEEKHIILTSKVIRQAEKDLSRQFDSSIYLFLADHVSYSINRNKKGQNLHNDLLWEIKKYYPREFAVAKRSLQLIERAENIRFNQYFDDEAAFITLHFINASSGDIHKNETVFTTKLISDILQIVEYFYGIKLDEQSINYDRFLTHIRYFVSRVFSKEKQVIDENELLTQVKFIYPKAYECSLRIKKHIDAQYDIKINNSELLYFVIHINRVTNRENK
ncbi:PRD domain-containing protein [Desemzia sp. RIT804]|uniref:PRD domain-containing protein n=1 Tax=Desemzia sp. RIT 804 TaxID=2810209 RepID=UPI00194FE126|nr:PRD domain-containing protein [Desemzia sp. RIT 804]